MARMTLRGATWLPCLALLLAPALAGAAHLNTQAGPFWMEVLTDGGPAPTYYHRGESYIMGEKGARYTLRVHNRTGRRVEAVVTVDGLDVLDGKTGSWSKRGYIVPAWGYVDIDGWRLSRADVAAFRFSSVASSYAGQTGRTRDVGVIGVAIFKERAYAPPRPVYVPDPYPYPPYPHPSYRDEHGRLGQGGLRSRDSGDASAEASRRAPAAERPAPAAKSAAPSSGAGRAASGPVTRQAPEREERPGLATAFGERTSSPVHTTTFQRASWSHPSAMLGARYNDHAGLVAMGLDLSYAGCCRSDPDLRHSATPFPASEPRYAAPPPGWPY